MKTSYKIIKKGNILNFQQVESPKERKTSMVECDDEGNPSSGTPDESPKQLTPHSIPPRRRRSPRRPEVSASRLPLKVLNQIFQYLPLKGKHITFSPLKLHGSVFRPTICNANLS